MKKSFLSAILITAAFAFASCEKDYECHCIKTSAAGEEHITITAKKKDAEQTCENVKTANPSLYSSCELD